MHEECEFSKTVNDAYLKLIEKISVFPADLPRPGGTISKKIFEFLEILMTPEEATLLAELSVYPFGSNTIEEIAEFWNKDAQETREILGQFNERGIVMNVTLDTGEKEYSIHYPILFFEFPFIDDIPGDKGKRLAELFRGMYEDEGWHRTFVGTSLTPLNRIIPVQEAIKKGTEVLPEEEIFKIIDAQEWICLLPCACRNRYEKIGIRKCTFPIETCFLMGPVGKWFIERGKGKRLTQEEAKKFIRYTTELGLIHLSENIKDAEGHLIICNCCSCCCCMLAGVAKLGNQNSIARAHFMAVMDSEIECNACGVCVERCQMHAIVMQDDVAEILSDKCIGCGVCAVKCPVERITLKRIEGREIPEHEGELWVKMFEECGKPYPEL